MSHSRSASTSIAALAWLSLAGCSSTLPPESHPKEPDSAQTAPAVAVVEEDSRYVELERLAQDAPTARDGERVLFRALGSGRTKVEAIEDARSNAWGAASSTRKVKIESLVTSINSQSSGPDGTRETSDFSARITAKSENPFSGGETVRSACSIQRSDSGFEAVVEIAVSAEQVYPAQTLERLSKEGPNALLVYAQENKARGDFQTEFLAYQRLLAQEPNTDVIRLYADRLIDLGFPEDAADLYGRWFERFPEWVKARTLSTAEHAVQGHVARGHYSQAIVEVRIWGRFDADWAARTEAMLKPHLDTPDELVDDLLGLVKLTELDSDDDRYYHPQDLQFSAILEWEEVTVTRTQRVSVDGPGDVSLGAICIDEGLISITPIDKRTPLPGDGRNATLSISYADDEQYEYRKGKVDYIVFLEPLGGIGISLPPGPGTPDEIYTSELDGDGEAALQLREQLRGFIEHLRSELDRGHLKAIHLKWSQK